MNPTVKIELEVGELNAVLHFCFPRSVHLTCKLISPFLLLFLGVLLLCSRTSRLRLLA